MYIINKKFHYNRERGKLKYKNYIFDNYKITRYCHFLKMTVY